MITHYEANNLTIKNRVLIKHDDEYILTTVGRVIFNSTIPEKVRFVNKKIGKKQLKGVLDQIFDVYGREQTVTTADDLKDLGFAYATVSSATMNIFDLIIPEEKKEILRIAGEKVSEIHTWWFRGYLEDEEKHKSIVSTWSMAKAKIEALVKETYTEGNDVFTLIDSKARGNR